MNRVHEFGDDWLEPLLRQPPGALDDDGFTERVMAGLRRRRRLRAGVLAVAGAGGFGLSAWLLPPAKFLAGILDILGALQPPAGHADLLALATAGLVLWLVAPAGQD